MQSNSKAKRYKALKKSEWRNSITYAYAIKYQSISGVTMAVYSVPDHLHDV